MEMRFKRKSLLPVVLIVVVLMFFASYLNDGSTGKFYGVDNTPVKTNPVSLDSSNGQESESDPLCGCPGHYYTENNGCIGTLPYMCTGKTCDYLSSEDGGPVFMVRNAPCTVQERYDCSCEEEITMRFPVEVDGDDYTQRMTCTLVKGCSVRFLAETSREHADNTCRRQGKCTYRCPGGLDGLPDKVVISCNEREIY